MIKKILNNMDMKMLEEGNILIQEHFIKVKGNHNILPMKHLSFFKYSFSSLNFLLFS